MNTSSTFSDKELNLLALEHLRSQGINTEPLYKQLIEQNQIVLQKPRLPEWQKSKNGTFAQNVLPPSEHIENVQQNTNSHHTSTLTKKPDTSLRSIFGSFLKLTRAQYPSLALPKKPSIFHQQILFPDKFTKREPVTKEEHPHLHAALDTFNRTRSPISISYAVANQQIGIPISSMIKRSPAFCLNYQHMITIEGHRNSAYSLCFDKSGRRLFTASDDRTIKVWSVYNGVLLYCLRGHEGDIIDISIDPTNKLLASASNDIDNQIRIWSLDEQYGYNLKVLKKHTSTISVVSFNPSLKEQLLLTCDIGGQICLWNSQNWDEEPISYHIAETTIVTAVWKKGGSLFVTGGSKVCVWSPHRGLLFVLPSPDYATFNVTSLQWCPHYMAIAAGSSDGVVFFWRCATPSWDALENWEGFEINTRTNTKTRSARCDGVSMLQFTSDGNYLVSFNIEEMKLSVWNTRTGGKLYDYSAHRDTVFTLLAHPSNPRLVITAGYDGLVTIFDVIAGKLLRAFMTNISISDGAFSNETGDCFAFTSRTGRLALFARGSRSAFLQTPTSQFFSSELNPLIYDDNNIAMDGVLNVPPNQVPREICDVLGQRYEDLPSSLLGPIPFTPKEIEIDDPYIWRIGSHRRDIEHDGTVSDSVADLFPILEPIVEPQTPLEPPSEEEEDDTQELMDDDDDDWEGPSRDIPRPSRRLQTRRRTYVETDSGSDMETDTHTPVIRSSRRSTVTAYPEWITTVTRIYNAYIPQLNDTVIYFVEGHAQYMELYRERDATTIPIADFCARCSVVRINHENVNFRRYRTKVRYSITLRLIDQEVNGEREFVVHYHPLSKCPDFLILSSLYDHCLQQTYIGKRFRMAFQGNEVYYGKVINVGTQGSLFPDSLWESLEVQWENNSQENDNHVSCWEIELLLSPQDAMEEDPLSDGESMLVDQGMNSESSDFEPEEELSVTPVRRELAPPSIDNLPPSTTSTVPVWLREDEMIEANERERISLGIERIREREESAEFRNPINLQHYPGYYTTIPFAIDLRTIVQRIENQFYRRVRSIIEDIQLLEYNALVFNSESSWYYGVACIIKRSLLLFIENNEWHDPVFEPYVEPEIPDIPSRVDRVEPEPRSRRRQAHVQYRDDSEDSGDSDSFSETPRRSTRTRRSMFDLQEVLEEPTDEEIQVLRRSARGRNENQSIITAIGQEDIEERIGPDEASPLDISGELSVEEYKQSSISESNEVPPPVKAKRKQKVPIIYYSDDESEEEVDEEIESEEEFSLEPSPVVRAPPRHRRTVSNSGRVSKVPRRFSEEAKSRSSRRRSQPSRTTRSRSTRDYDLIPEEEPSPSPPYMESDEEVLPKRITPRRAASKKEEPTVESSVITGEENSEELSAQLLEGTYRVQDNEDSEKSIHDDIYTITRRSTRNRSMLLEKRGHGNVNTPSVSTRRSKRAKTQKSYTFEEDSEDYFE